MTAKILIADDDDNVAFLLKDILEIEGHTVVTAADGAAALDVYQKEKPDLIILDIAMPQKDGFDVCKTVRRKDKRVLILFLTALKFVNVDQALNLGADDFVLKPFGPNELCARVKSLLRRLPPGNPSLT
jgi:two-component system alkaline phosphatase synthesis response regulator PhoP